MLVLPGNVEIPPDRLTMTVYREVLLGITGKDFTLIAASKAAMRGATILKATDDKTRELSKHTLMAFSGEAGDTGTVSSASCLLRWFAHTKPLRSSIRRVYSSQHPAVFDAERVRAQPCRSRQLCPRRTCPEFEIAEPIHSQPPPGWCRSDHGETQLILARLSSGAGAGTVCCPRIRSVRTITFTDALAPPAPKTLGPPVADHWKDTTASLYSINIITPIFLMKRA